MSIQPEEVMRQAIGLAVENVGKGGGPFGAVVVRDGAVIATGVNMVTANNDPTAHAEVVAIRNACKAINSFQLDGCELYASCEPCPMCLGAIYWARLKKFYFACSREDAAGAHFDDSFIYDQLSMAAPTRSIPGYCLLSKEGLRAFDAWSLSQSRIHY